MLIVVKIYILQRLYRDQSFLKCCSFMLICVCFGGVDLMDVREVSLRSYIMTVIRVPFNY